MENDAFKKTLQENCKFFSETTVYYFEQFSGKKFNAQFDVVKVEPVSNIKNDNVLSISYLGMVFGEYLLSVPDSLAIKVFEDFGSDEETVQGCLKEVLNMITGKSITFLGGSYDKLTITAPKLVRGELMLADLLVGSVNIKTDFGDFKCYMYIDRMKLDLVSSYNDTIEILKRTNSQLSNANEKLKEQQSQLVHQEKMASLGMLAAGVAHEINNPLSFISGNIEVLTTYVEAMKTMIDLYEKVTTSVIQSVNQPNLNAYSEISSIREKEKIDFIIKDTYKLITESREGVERITNIVVALKKFSKIEDGKSKLVDINEEINNVLILLNNQMQDKGCKINLHLNNLPKIKLESFGLTQVFSNIIINSLQAVKTNEGVIDIDGNIDGTNLVLSFKDNGSGISDENMKKVFNPFFTTKNQGEGTGLGLAISYGIIKKHNGQIQVQSQIGKGTVFKIVIPFQERISYAS
jgi:signal transduction histidine kinase